MKSGDTIVGISTPPGRGGIGVVRISGPGSREIAECLIRFQSSLKPRHATLGELIDEHGEVCDEIVATWFQAPRSYTAEDVVEISCHGAPVILRHCLDRAIRMGARPAEPGEFTLRAFANGRIDLPQAEAIRDLIDSTTLYQARLAARQSGGSVSRLIAPLKFQLLELIALLEAGIDFAEDDISVAPKDEILRRLDPLIERTSTLVRGFAWGKLIRNGFSLAITGRPNAGKSSLFNRLLEQDRAIVTDIPGTTRDLVSETVELGGIPVRLMDTAGIRETGETVEKLGVERSLQAMVDADLTVVVIDGASARTEDDGRLAALAHRHGRALIAASKSDLPGFHSMPGELPVSSVTGQGISELRQAILRQISPADDAGSAGEWITALRQANLLDEAKAGLEKAKTAVLSTLPHELLLLDLYCALNPLDSISGATTADDILNKIFATFCIGK